MPFSEPQIKRLSGKLDSKHVRTRELSGHTFSYVEGCHLIAEANRTFGFDGWDRETMSAACIWAEAKREPKTCAYAVRVRVRVRAGETIISREGSSVGHGSGSTLAEAHESALKEAETDAMKQALATFGNLFGLALYDKEQNGLRAGSKGNQIGAQTVAWVLLSSKGRSLSRHDNPQSFCAAMRDALASVQGLDELHALWRRNATTMRQLRTTLPELKAPNGTHYGDVLEKLYEQHGVAWASLTKQEETISDGGSARSVFLLPQVKRIRDKSHLQFVASLPCLVCGRMPSQAHHLKFAQPRALASKPSDEWTVPLCLLHHRALHNIGSEETWWQEHRIDAKGEAQRLWHRTQGSGASEIKITQIATPNAE